MISRQSTEFPWGYERPMLDGVAASMFTGRLSQDEEDVLRDTVWRSGQDMHLREDIRFRETPWGKWMLSSGYLANEEIVARLRAAGTRWLEIEEALAALDRVVQRRCVICPRDPRLVVSGGKVRLAARELSEEPLIEANVPPIERYVTHLPIHTLRAAAASEPLGQWGRRAQDEVVETLGWLEVVLPGKKLTPRMFVARVEGHSMDDGKTGIRDGSHIVFEFGAGDFDLAPIVLARGAFDDPETGSYAVKRIRVERAPDGSVERLRLLSAHPDKTRYPDIVVDERDQAAVTVLARFIAALGPDDHARAPRPESPPRRRDIASPEGAEKHRARLAKALLGFFGPPRTEAAGKESEETAGDWTADLALPACDPAALSAVLGPLGGLPSRVKIVAVQTGNLQRVVFASNVRTKRFGVPVSPSTEPYRWSAEGFEEELAEDMERLTISGLAADVATVFRIDADGVGQRLKGATVTPGSRYRLLVPPALAAAEIPGALEHDGWRAIDVNVPSPVPETRVDLLRSIGVAVGADAYSMSFAVTSPRDHGRGRGGELYPMFAPADGVFVAIAGPPSLLDGDVCLVVQGERESAKTAVTGGEPAKGAVTGGESAKGAVTGGEPAKEAVAGGESAKGAMAGGESAKLPLPAGERWLVEMGSLSPGSYVVEVVPVRTSVQTTRLFFRVDERARPLPRADITVRVGPPAEGSPAAPGVDRALEPGLAPEGLAPAPEGLAPEQEPEERDLALLGTPALPLTITAPPLWPVAAHFRGAARVRGPILPAEEDGSCDVTKLLSRSASARRDEVVGDLTLDFGELGARVLPHRRALVDAAHAELPALITQRIAALPAFLGQPDMLYSQWLAPVCKLLGYTFRALPVLATLDLPPGFRAWILETTYRVGASIERRPATLLVVAPPAQPLSSPSPSSLPSSSPSSLPLSSPLSSSSSSGADPKSEAVRLCRKLNLPEAIVTDGRAWAKVRAAHRLMSTPIDLEDALRRAPLGGLDDFLSAFLAGGFG